MRPYANVDWLIGRVYETFVHHAAIEPGESIEDPILIALPASVIAVRLEFRIVSGDQEWNAEEIVYCNLANNQRSDPNLRRKHENN